MEQITPCLKCNGLVFWRDRSNAIHCSTCKPARAAWLIRERLRATTEANSRLRSAQQFILLALGNRERIAARTVVDAAERATIAPATLTRAREQLKLRSVRTRTGWVWVRPPH